MNHKGNTISMHCQLLGNQAPVAYWTRCSSVDVFAKKPRKRYIRSMGVLIIFLWSIQAFAQTIPFRLTLEGHILVEAEVEGHRGTFIFDTGGGINLFFSDFAKKLKHQRTYNFFTVFRATGERLDVQLLYNDQLKFGSVLFKEVPYTTFEMTIPGIDGLLSLQMFQSTDLTIDYPGKVLVLKDIDTEKNKEYIDIQISTFADHALDIFTYVVLDGKYRIKVLLDSGAGSDSFWVSSRFRDMLGVDSPANEESEKKSEFGKGQSNRVYTAQIQSISSTFSTVRQPTVKFVDGLIYEGKTSINWLGSKIGISLRNKKIYLLH